MVTKELAACRSGKCPAMPMKPRAQIEETLHRFPPLVKSADERRSIRQVETKPIMEALHARLIAMRNEPSQISLVTKAINYTLAQRSGLTRFLDDGRIEPDTKIVEHPTNPSRRGG